MDLRVEYFSGQEVERVPPFNLDIDKEIFGDGSGINPLHVTIARAGVSVAQLNGEHCHKLARAPVPDFLPQTAAVAERLAIMLANKLLTGTSEKPYVGDCKGALKLWSRTLTPGIPGPSGLSWPGRCGAMA